jgi:hypothetical protein
MSNETNRVKLLGISDPFRGKEFYITSEEFNIGRSSDSDLLLAENTISANHAKVVKSGNSFELLDLNSTNGTYINDERISRKELRSDDVIKFDVYEFRFINAADVARTVLADSPDFEKVPEAKGNTKESPMVQAQQVKEAKRKKKAKAEFEKTGNMPLGLIIGVLVALIIYSGAFIGIQIMRAGMPYDITPLIEGSFVGVPMAHTHFAWMSTPSWDLYTILFLVGVALASLLGGFVTRAISKANVFASSLYFALTYAVVVFLAQLIVTKLAFTKLSYFYAALSPFGIYNAWLAMPIIFAYFIVVSFVLAFIGGLFKGK